MKAGVFTCLFVFVLLAAYSCCVVSVTMSAIGYDPKVAVSFALGACVLSQSALHFFSR